MTISKKYFASMLTAFFSCLLCPFSGLGAVAGASVFHLSFLPAIYK
jgi:hypothetical protein